MPSETEQAFIELIRRLRDDENAARRHRRIEYEEGHTLEDLFDEGLDGNTDLALMLKALREKSSKRDETEGRKLVVAGQPNESLLLSIITPDSDDEIRSMSRKFSDEDREVVRQWIAELPVEEEPPIDAPEPRLK